MCLSTWSYVWRLLIRCSLLENLFDSRLFNFKLCMFMSIRRNFVKSFHWIQLNMLCNSLDYFDLMIFHLLWVELFWHDHLFSNELLDCVDLMWWLFIFKQLWITMMVVYFKKTSNYYDVHLFSNDIILLWSDMMIIY